MAKKKTHTGINKQVNKEDLDQFKVIMNRKKVLEEAIAMGYQNLKQQEAELQKVGSLYEEVQDAMKGQLKAWEEISGPNYELDLEEGVLIHPDNIESWNKRKAKMKDAKN